MKTSNRNNEVKIKLDREENEKIKKKAEKLGIKVSQYIRMCSLNANIEIK